MSGVVPTNPPMPEFKVGSYRLLKALGTGGMSSVFHARHVDTGLEVAVKVLPRTLAKNTTLLQRFLREAKSAEALEHPNIVAIYDRGVDQGRHYLVLEYVAGGDLHDWVRAHGPMPIPEAIAVIRSVAEGLRFAAERGLIHRDVKPANILRTPEGRVKIADLGLALHAEDEDERVTREGTTVGTVDYMSPEQARDSRATSARSDIYSLGCTLFFLLTGQAPYPGGDVADKLTRHCSAPIPELLGFRPDAPPELERLLKKMLAKRPERRVASYEELIASLDGIPGVEATFSGNEPNPEPPLYAILDDEDDGGRRSDEFIPLTLPGPRRPSSTTTRTHAPEEISIADLAELDHAGPTLPTARRNGVAKPIEPDLVPLEDDPIEPEEEAPLLDDDHGPNGSLPGHYAVPSSRKMTDSEKSWLTTWIALGVILVFCVIGADLLIRSTSNPTEVGTESNHETEPINPTEPTAVQAPVVAIAPKAATKSAITQIKPKQAVAPQPVEPVDIEPETVVEKTFTAGVEARFRPDWAANEVPTRLPGSIVTVQRLISQNEPNPVSTIRAGLDVKGGGTVEIADNGPFFEDDLRPVGDLRALRGRPGFRPVVSVESRDREVQGADQALFDLEGRSLILDGLDLVIDARAFRSGQSALFSCRGGTLTFRNCTVSVINRGEAPLSVVRAAASDRPTRIRFVQTYVRGSFVSLVELAGGAAEVVLDRSAVVNGQGGLIAATGTGPGDRRLFLSRSLVATRGSAIASTDPTAGKTRAILVRSLATTFAHIASPRPAPLFEAMSSSSATELLGWEGVDNHFHGWSAWLSAGTPSVARVASLEAARSIWPGTDRESREEKADWVISAPFDLVPPGRVASLATPQGAMATRLPMPSASLFEKTTDRFSLPSDPGFTPPKLPALSVRNLGLKTDPRMRGAISGVTEDSRRPDRPNGGMVTSLPEASKVSAGGVRDLTFDANAVAWEGDLGRFVNASMKPGDRVVRVIVGGSGNHQCSPIRMPAGVSLEITAVPDGQGSLPSWFASRTLVAEGLIELKNASARLDGLVLTRDSSSRVGSLVRVERGHLVLNRCRLSSQDSGPALVNFLAPGSLPLQFQPLEGIHPAWPFNNPTDRPTLRVTESILQSSGDTISADAGRGLVIVGNSVVVADGRAVVLNPGRVARQRLDADLWLDHCTLVSGSGSVGLGPWNGSEPGPDRPWVVHSRRCMFLGLGPQKGADGVVLQVQPDSFAHGALFWQSFGDAFETPAFLSASGQPAPEGRKPDVIRQWADLWGASHFHSVLGPRPPSNLPDVRTVGRPRLGQVELGDLYLESGLASDSSAARDLGADLARLGIARSVRSARRKP